MNMIVYRNSGTKDHSSPTCGASRRYRSSELVLTADQFTRINACHKSACMNHSYETTTAPSWSETHGK